MLRLDDPRWGELQSNYGTGSSTAQLLSRAIAGDPLDGWYDDLFQELLHQYTLSQVAFAAMPHLLEIARQRPDTRMHLLILIGACYAHAADPKAPLIPVDFKKEWHSTAQKALTLICTLLAEDQFSENELRYLLAALAALHGHHQLSVAVEALDTLVECPQCGALIVPMQYDTGET